MTDTMKLYKPSAQLLPSVKANLGNKDNQDSVLLSTFYILFLVTNQPDADHFVEIYFAIKNYLCAWILNIL